ncbi:hypothetical protein A2U01_0097467, partial [Trifolium medium]|nr:hypothetical protein [Trifolium medium]
MNNDGFRFGSGVVSVRFQPPSSLLLWWSVAQLVLMGFG